MRIGSSVWMVLLLFLLLFQHLGFGSSLNHEGKTLLKFRERIEVDPFGSLRNWGEDGGQFDPCSWTGVACEDRRVISLNLKNLCLKGTLTPHLGKLTHLRYLNLHNNSFYGIIPIGILELDHLKVLNLGYNNFRGPLPDLANMLSLKVCELRGNPFLQDVPKLNTANLPTSLTRDPLIWRSDKEALIRRFLQSENAAGPQNMSDKALAPTTKVELSKFNTSSTTNDGGAKQGDSLPVKTNYTNAAEKTRSPTPTPSPSRMNPSTPTPSPPRVNPSTPTPSPPRVNRSSPTPSNAFKSPEVLKSPSFHNEKEQSSSIKQIWPYITICAGLVVLISVMLIYVCRKNKVVGVKPWVTGLSGQLQKAFVTGVPALKRSELEAACEDFSNIIGSHPDSTLCKGTLSSGVEIAVNIMKSDVNWSKQCQAQFRKKIETLSKANHKNFVNLIGYCEEEKPHSRMMVFEYAPNGTLFEHLHAKDADHLDWVERLRVAMGVAYCFDHMHQLDPPLVLRALDSHSILLTDDFAAKIADFDLWSKTKCGEEKAKTSNPLTYQMPDQESIVHKFGILLLELISGRPPYSEESGGLVSWASDYLKGDKPLEALIDPTLMSFSRDNYVAICRVVGDCLNPNPLERPNMNDVVRQLRQITGLTPESAAPKLSPLWWAELEIISPAME